MTLIAVIMGAPTRDVRNDAARRLLDYGFANYALYRSEGRRWSDIPITGGSLPFAEASLNAFSAVVKKSELSQVESIVSLPDRITAPISIGDRLGTVTYKIGENAIGELPIISCTESLKMNYWQVLLKLIQTVIFSRKF
jgi:D-alanyl-D-alanine carboxypeptidase (penicillin-binding protein 5/6)